MGRHRHPEIHPAYLVILVILCAASLVSCLWFFVEKTKIYQELTQKINWLNKENDSLSVKIEKTEKEKLNLTNQLQQFQEKIKELTTTKTGFSNKLDSLMEENQKLASGLKDLTQDKLILEKKIEDWQNDTFLSDLIKEKASLEIQLSALKQELQVTQPNLQDIFSSQTTVDAKLDEIIQAKVKMEEALKSERQLTENLSYQLLEERKERILAKAEKGNIQSKLDETERLQNSLQIQLAKATADLEIVKKEKESLSSQLVLLSQTIGTKTKELEAMSSVLDKIPTPTRTSSSVQLPPVIVRADKRIEWTVPRSQGDIISIDREHNFVIINLGEDDGIRPGLIFKVTQQDVDIAEVEVIQARQSISACNIKELKSGHSIQKDNKVALIP